MEIHFETGRRHGIEEERSRVEGVIAPINVLREVIYVSRSYIVKQKADCISSLLYRCTGASKLPGLYLGSYSVRASQDASIRWA